MAARGYSLYKTLNLTATPQQVSLGHVVIGGYFIANLNPTGTWIYLKTWDLAGAPNVGSDASRTTWPIPGGAAANTLLPQYSVGDEGLAYYNGLWIAATASLSDLASDNPPLSTVVVNLYYI